MAMTQGTVTIDENGDPSGGGFARALYDDYVAKFSAIPAGADGVPAKQQIADLCNSVARVIGYVQNNAEVTTTVSTSDAGLQLLPATLQEDEPTKAPSGTKTLSNKGSIA